ncbi:MAG: inositol monophosphatase, partial [Candidatus Tectomicrobia bacterium]|nr:inositol monophosphatase [Candidatus Tectomicrobia bacterium]
MQRQDITAALSAYMPPVLRWAGAIARQLRQYDISVSGKKTSGSASTDALTLADLSVQELLVAALRDSDPIFRQCRLEAEESTGDLERFASQSDYTIALDPIDGTQRYRDRNGDGWCVMLNLRSVET